ncbi:MAG TPA: 4'-phosphopantetheinyl transferase superfamily protein [Steroidobacteraceae bacterium]|nr:4'-phosphopantetheinyl transferase superfamily protein [Steroidobacteraceae bacterium]
MPIHSQFARHGAAAPNPATLSTAFSELFPPGVAAAELRMPGDASLLYPEEAVSVAKAVPKRVGEFAAGRLCARRALAEFGITGVPLTMAPDRAPVWPESMVGSITHTRGLCAAVVAERRRFASLGIDVEVAGDVKRDLWRHICVAAESAWLESLPVSAQASAATLLFSAKEAFYKCQYSITRERLNFSDLHAKVAESGEAGGSGREGTVLVTPTRPLSIATSTSATFRGRYLFRDPHVAVAMYLPAAFVNTPCRPETPLPPS